MVIKGRCITTFPWAQQPQLAAAAAVAPTRRSSTTPASSRTRPASPMTCAFWPPCLSCATSPSSWVRPESQCAQSRPYWEPGAGVQQPTCARHVKSLSPHHCGRHHHPCRVFQKLVYTTPKELPKEKETPMKAASKLRAFIKRSSEPLLNMQPQPVASSSSLILAKVI